MRTLSTACLLALTLAVPAQAQWIHFEDETATRLAVAPGLGASDVAEKDYAWGDVDKDGDIDLVIVRKQPFTSPGKRINLLLLNEGGVLTDRTAEHVVDASVPGDQGFLTPTNDRDVLLVDLDGDSWLDIVTAVTLSDGDPKHIGHPRVYVNQGQDGSNNWLGYRFEEAFIPEMESYTNESGRNPRFCSVAAGDLTGDLAPELWFGDYDSSGAGGFSQPPGADFNDRLMLNLNASPGRMSDQTQARLLGAGIQLGSPVPFELSAFGAAAVIADMNGDGALDIVKQTALTAPQYVGIAYNDPDNEGFFDTYQVVDQSAPYFVSVGDLNRDRKLDLVITDDGQDHYLLNQGNNPDGTASFVTSIFSYEGSADTGFGGNSLIVDLDEDGWNDVLIADIDVDIDGCDRRMNIFHNQGGAPGGAVELREETDGSGCAANVPSCLVAGIPADRLVGVHDVAAFDIDGDGRKDLVVGRCSGTEIWMNVEVVLSDILVTFPDGVPDLLPPAATAPWRVQFTAVGVASIDSGSERIFASIDGGAEVEVPTTDLGGGLFEAQLPGGSSCLSTTSFRAEARIAGGDVVSSDSFEALSHFGFQIVYAEDAESDTSEWTIDNAPGTDGGWERAEPNGTLTGGLQAAPDEDAEPGSASFAFVTGNGPPGGAAADDDVDVGPTTLISPPIDLAGSDGFVAYERWFFNDDLDSDTLTVEISPDGNAWTPLENVVGQENQWTRRSFRVSDYIVPSATTQLRFSVTDLSNNSITEAGIDAVTVEGFICGTCIEGSECDDGAFCNGAEICSSGACAPGADPCPGQSCDEATDSCLECVVDSECNDGLYCTGTEVCVGNSCLPGSDPCPDSQCSESLQSCVACLEHLDCDDGLFCNGQESCSGGACSAPYDPCPGRTCDEDGDSCVGNVTLQPRMGQPLAGLTVDELNRFEAGKLAFNTTLTAAEGLGPIFNQNACASCHNNPIGGSGTIRVTRFGFNDDKGGGFDALDGLGGSLLQSESLEPQCAESIPPAANVTALRVTNSILGFGLVEAIPDADLLALESNPPSGVSGRVHLVEALEQPGVSRAGRFGWKSQVATVLSFAGDAALNEMGLTNRLMPTENAPNGDVGLLALCDGVADPEDSPDAQGFEFIDRVTDFQRFLAPPPQTPRYGMSGEVLFHQMQCATCHRPTFATPDDPQLETALRARVLRPYSDFLLHDMGANADFIEQGGAGMRELRTTPLWGLRKRDPLWHDGRVAGGSFADRVSAAIALHDSVGSEGAASAQAFASASSSDRDALIAFLDSLGRAEFDHDGDNDVDLTDFGIFLNCYGGGFYDADDGCSISDVDQDGDVDDDDFVLFDMAVQAPVGTSGGLTLDKATGGAIRLDWQPSCNPGDIDYAIYAGTLGDFASHASLECSTGGATAATFVPADGALYYLVTSMNELREGLLGRDSTGAARPVGAEACVPRGEGICE